MAVSGMQLNTSTSQRVKNPVEFSWMKRKRPFAQVRVPLSFILDPAMVAAPT